MVQSKGYFQVLHRVFFSAPLTKWTIISLSKENSNYTWVNKCIICQVVSPLFIHCWTWWVKWQPQGDCSFLSGVISWLAKVATVWTPEKLQLYKYSWRWVEAPRFIYTYSRVNYRPPGWKLTLLLHMFWVFGEFGFCLSYSTTGGKKGRFHYVSFCSIIDLTGCCFVRLTFVWRDVTALSDVGFSST